MTFLLTAHVFTTHVTPLSNVAFYRKCIRLNPYWTDLLLQHQLSWWNTLYLLNQAAPLHSLPFGVIIIQLSGYYIIQRKRDVLTRATGTLFLHLHHHYCSCLSFPLHFEHRLHGNFLPHTPFHDSLWQIWLINGPAALLSSLATRQ